MKNLILFTPAVFVVLAFFGLQALCLHINFHAWDFMIPAFVSVLMSVYLCAGYNVSWGKTDRKTLTLQLSVIAVFMICTLLNNTTVVNIHHVPARYVYVGASALCIVFLIVAGKYVKTKEHIPLLSKCIFAVLGIVLINCIIQTWATYYGLFYITLLLTSFLVAGYINFDRRPVKSIDINAIMISCVILFVSAVASLLCQFWYKEIVGLKVWFWVSLVVLCAVLLLAPILRETKKDLAK